MQRGQFYLSDMVPNIAAICRYGFSDIATGDVVRMAALFRSDLYSEAQHDGHGVRVNV